MNVEPAIVELVAKELAALDKRREGGKLAVKLGDHRLARDDGWAVAARWVLLARWRHQGVGPGEERCEVDGCGRRVAWSKQRNKPVGNVSACVPWFLDRNPENLAADNVMGVCAGCQQRGIMADRGRERGDRGRFVGG